ncbi:BnaCnng30480D [Brassica napus]|uniref:BnaCnng30480D protein n=1 Tax=Brassica napus TaxID=3708 RepID=A0A078IXA0_BRANA|nr:BnaCnng30480D [Brassica napus]
MSRLPHSVMLFAFVLLLLELQLEPWKRPPASGDTASGRVLSTSDFGLSPADPDLLTETRSDLPSGTVELPYLVLLSPPLASDLSTVPIITESSGLLHLLATVSLPRHKLPPSSPLQS